ncbi:hypothetical protein AtubIFM55763_008820 [Aspergillus tubingensis]|nr:hypothetical protein AtubIFM55763_008820 [Aspergillus tubingensis]
MTQSQGLYHKLDPTLKQIRLVTIEPGRWTDDIQCTLRETSLADSEPYETLSYVWGDPTNTKYIFVNGKSFRATANLESALRHLRRDTPRTMWIDAICINQRDLGERASQVSIMRYIYQGSKLTVIWLGDGDERAESSFDLARRFYDQSHSDGVSSQGILMLMQELTNTEYRRQSLKFLVTEILRRPWWTRAWVLQEAAVSAELLVACGTHEIAWSPLCWLADIVFTGTYSSNFLGRISTRGLEEVLKIQRMREATKEGHIITLTQLVAWNRRQRSTDPRDKIFSLLGLAIDYLPGCIIRPDYSSYNTLLVVCLCLVEQSIRSDRLDVISLCQGSEKPQWPSWVPDWDVYTSEKAKTASPLVRLFAGGEQLNAKTFWCSLSSDYDASCCRLPKFEFHLNPVALTVLGISVGTIDSLAATYQPEEHEQWASSKPDPWVALLTSYFEGPTQIPEISSWRYAAHSFRNSMPMKTLEEKRFVSMSIKVMKKARESGNGCGYASGGSLADAYLRTLMADTVGIGQRQTDFLQPLYLDEFVFSNSAPSDEDLEEDDSGYVLGKSFIETYCTYASLFDSAITRATSYRRMMISSKGYIGLVPAKAQEGDHICVLYGCSVPVILRKKGDHYVLIGESYVHGIMDGEALSQKWDPPLVEDAFTLV